MSTVVFFHAHPDDEAIATGGTMAGLSEAGHRVVLVTATRGELGEVPDGFLAEGELLGARRSAELAAAAEILGVHRLEFLGYEDSGMEGEPSATRPGCFATADVAEATSRLAGLLAEEAADVLVVYDEHGGYGHPDHVQVHVVGMAAAEQAGTPVVYLTTMDRDFMRALRAQAADLAAAADDAESGWAPSEEELEGTETMGEPAERITTEVDVRPWVAAKRAAMAAHASQIAEESFFLAMPEDVFADVWGQEWFVRIRPEPAGLGQGVREPGLLVDAAGTLAGGAATRGRTA
jgi:LmbE family N-acetylglucosaminyl deacetylase